jgi:hypothetical protein
MTVQRGRSPVRPDTRHVEAGRRRLMLVRASIGSVRLHACGRPFRVHANETARPGSAGTPVASMTSRARVPTLRLPAAGRRPPTDLPSDRHPDRAIVVAATDASRSVPRPARLQAAVHVTGHQAKRQATCSVGARHTTLLNAAPPASERMRSARPSTPATH